MTADRWVDLLLNVITEALGIIVTVFFVDRLLKKREEARWKPSKSLAYSKLVETTSEIIKVFLTTSLLEKYDYVCYRFDTSYAGPAFEIADVDLVKERSSKEMTDFLSSVTVQQALKIFESLSKARETLREVINDSGFFLDPEALALGLELESNITSTVKYFNSLHNFGEGGYIIGADSVVATISVYGLLRSVQDLQKWLVAHCTRRDELN
jgi:hypothetical protein